MNQTPAENTSETIIQALRNERFRKAIESISQSFLSASAGQTSLPEIDNLSNATLPWNALRAEHNLVLLEQLAQQAERGAKQEYADVADALNPLRSLWTMCFQQFAQESIKATNYVTPAWTSSAQGDKDSRIQNKARSRGVTIERVYILEEGDLLPEQMLHELRQTMVRQLNAGIKLYVIKASKVDAYVTTSLLGTNDFILFDDQLVYATIVDRVSKVRERRDPYVRLYDDERTVNQAKEAWETLMERADATLTFENLIDYVDPYGSREDI